MEPITKVKGPKQIAFKIPDKNSISDTECIGFEIINTKQNL